MSAECATGSSADANEHSPTDPIPESRNGDTKHLPVASWNHLAIFLALQLVITLSSGTVTLRLFALGEQNTLPFLRSGFYLSIIAFEIAQLLFVWYGLKKTNTSISTLIGGGWSCWWDALKDVLFGFLLWLLWVIAAIVLVIAFSPQGRGPDVARGITPHAKYDIFLWLAVSASAGFCEEVVYRGYLQRQFLALTSNVPLAIVFQAIVFGAIHRAQGVFGVMVIFVMAILFGWFAQRRRSLRPGIVAHFWHDALVGVIYFVYFTTYSR